MCKEYWVLNNLQGLMFRKTKLYEAYILYLPIYLSIDRSVNLICKITGYLINYKG